MVMQDSKGFYGHDDLLSLSLSLKFIFNSLFRTLITFSYFSKNSLIFQNKKNNNKIITKRTKNFLFNFRASSQCPQFRRLEFLNLPFFMPILLAISLDERRARRDPRPRPRSP
jgi:hypothetical protein